MELGEAAAVPPPPAKEENPSITSVTILQDDDKTAGGGKQFTNLPPDAKWVDGVDVLHKARLGLRLRIKVTFDKPGAHGFKLKLKPSPANSVYTGGEKGRNDNFKYQEAEKSYTTGGDGTKIVEDDFFVAAGGNDGYTVVAKDDAGKEVTSGSLTTRRLAWVVELKMKNLASVASNIASMTGEFAKHGLKLIQLTAVDMDHLPNISASAADTAALKSKAKTAYSGSTGPSKKPYVIAIAYTDHLAVKDSGQTLSKAGVEVGPGKTDVQIPIVDASGEKKYLWHDLVPGEGWFVSASFLADGAAAGAAVAIAASDCKPLPVNAANPNLWSTVEVKVSGLAAAKGVLTVKVDWVNRMRGGISLSGNIVCVCTRAWWRDKTGPEQNQVMIHEIGHQLTMVSDGTGKGPDKVSTEYTGKGHVGSHCHHALGVLASYANVTGDCVMFGATNGVTAFCANCAPAVVKQDLSAGWTEFS